MSKKKYIQPWKQTVRKDAELQDHCRNLEVVAQLI